jgi:hypothetical protein
LAPELELGGSDAHCGRGLLWFLKAYVLINIAIAANFEFRTVRADFYTSF